MDPRDPGTDDNPSVGLEGSITLRRDQHVTGEALEDASQAFAVATWGAAPNGAGLL